MFTVALTCPLSFYRIKNRFRFPNINRNTLRENKAKSLFTKVTHVFESFNGKNCSHLFQICFSTVSTIFIQVVVEEEDRGLLKIQHLETIQLLVKC